MQQCSDIKTALAQCKDIELRNTFARAIAAQRKFEIRLFGLANDSAEEPEKK